MPANKFTGQGQKIDGEIRLRFFDKTIYKQFVLEHDAGTWFNMTVTKAIKPKSNPQLGYYYAMIVSTAIQAFTSEGHTKTLMGIEVALGKDDADQLLKHFCGRMDDEGNVVIHDPEKHPDREILEKKDASKDQMRQYMNNCIEWLNGVHKCSIPQGE